MGRKQRKKQDRRAKQVRTAIEIMTKRKDSVKVATTGIDDDPEAAGQMERRPEVVQMTTESDVIVTGTGIVIETETVVRRRKSETRRSESKLSGIGPRAAAWTEKGRRKKRRKKK